MTNDYGAPALERLEALAAISDEPDRLTRLYLSNSHLRAIGIVADWMREAGMEIRIDAVGNVIGRYEGLRPAAPALLMGSHIDTVSDAGKYDGNLGVVAAIAVVAELNRRRQRFSFAIEVLAFGDEEGVRFPSTLLGSRAVAGTAPAAMLEARDKNGISIEQALSALHPHRPSLASAAFSRDKCLGYVEIHIEQGPVLETEGLALGIVTAINGAGRFKLTLDGTAGHSGTVPMALRHDALVAAAEIIMAVESKARATPELVATVGFLHVEPGAVNVIPGRVVLKIDIRGPEDAVRLQASRDIIAKAEEIARARGIALAFEQFHEAPVVRCDPALVGLLSGSVARLGHEPRLLRSGAGHDAMIVASLCPVVMLFTRCAGGISHNPAESATVEDIDAAIRVLLAFVSDFAAQLAPHHRLQWGAPPSQADRTPHALA